MQASRELLKHEIAVPYSLPLPTEESNWTVAFEKPTDMFVAGSWVTKSGVKSRNEDVRWTVDLAVEMPAVS
jgi:U3 small nucleolar RNA-associated protein 22